MSFAENFEDLKIWQEARILCNETYNTVDKLRDFDFKNQIQRAAVSVMNNIAEGFERRTKKDFAHFLDLAKGSAGEVRSMLYLAEDRNYLNSDSADQLRSSYKRLSTRHPPPATRYPPHGEPASSFTLHSHIRKPCNALFTLAPTLRKPSGGISINIAV